MAELLLGSGRVCDVTIDNWLCVSIVLSHVYQVGIGCAELAKKNKKNSFPLTEECRLKKYAGDHITIG